KISTFINSIVRTADDHFTLITDFNIIGESDGNQSTAVVFSLKLGSVRSRNFIVALEEKIFRYYSEYWWSSVFNSDCLRRDIHVTTIVNRNTGALDGVETLSLLIVSFTFFINIHITV